MGRIPALPTLAATIATPAPCVALRSLARGLTRAPLHTWTAVSRAMDVLHHCVHCVLHGAKCVQRQRCRPGLGQPRPRWREHEVSSSRKSESLASLARLAGHLDMGGAGGATRQSFQPPPWPRLVLGWRHAEIGTPEVRSRHSARSTYFQVGLHGERDLAPEIRRTISDGSEPTPGWGGDPLFLSPFPLPMPSELQAALSARPVNGYKPGLKDLINSG